MINKADTSLNEKRKKKATPNMWNQKQKHRLYN